MTDEEFFETYKDRNYRIRPPSKVLTRTKQRSMIFAEECEAEFLYMGPHNKDRRRLIVWRVPPDNPFYDPQRRPLLKVPMLLFADETVEDTDAVLAPILHGIMEQSRDKFARMN